MLTDLPHDLGLLSQLIDSDTSEHSIHSEFVGIIILLYMHVHAYKYNSYKSIS